MSEVALQTNCFTWLWNYYPGTRRMFFHVANELPNDVDYILNQVAKFVGSPKWFLNLRIFIKKRIQIYLAKRKASGVVAGIPDCILIQRGLAYGFEFKTPTGTVSSAQDKVHKAWLEDGTPVYIIRSVEEFQSTIFNLLGEPVATTRKETAA